MYRIGVDVGGTNTDSAILDITLSTAPSRGVLASSKTPTTKDVTSGIRTAVEAVLKKSAVASEKVLSVSIGTTHFVNAVVEADPKRLSRVAVVRLCGPFTRQVPPFADFPQALRKTIQGPTFYVDGGLEIDGREISSLNVDQIKEVVEEIKKHGITTIALVGVFSPLDHGGVHEDRCRDIMLEQDPSLSVVCSHNIGNIGLLERENATILNASILPLAQKTVRAFVTAMSHLRLSCPLFLTQNDGTLTDSETAAQFPIKTFASGPTNSMTGAVFLASLDVQGSSLAGKQTVIVDIGGTTTDVCALMPSGFPRQAPTFVEVGGVRTAFSMPEVLSIGLGGGSIVHVDGESDEVAIGPESVGYLLPEKALVFGGDVMTCTDIVVASGAQEIGNKSHVSKLSTSVVTAAREKIKKMLEDVIEGMKVSSLPIIAIMCGGGSVLQMDDLAGVSQCITPPHYDSANAVGAAIAKVAGELDVIEILAGRDEQQVMEEAKRKAIEIAVERGADKDDVHIAEIEKMPLQYAANKATRIKIRAVGKLKIPDTIETPTHQGSLPTADEEADDEGTGITKAVTTFESSEGAMISSDIKPSQSVDLVNYKPYVRDSVWYLTPVDFEFISLGVGVLGTGGGGPSYLQYLATLHTYHTSPAETIRVIAPKSLSDEDVVVFGSWYGAPSVSGERMPAGPEIMTAIDYSMRLSKHSNSKIAAVVADEIGGGNGMSTFPTSAHYDIPVIDGDLMGRAYPTMEHGTCYVYGETILPCVLADGKGNVSAIMQAESNTRIETMLRATCVELGLKTAVAATPLTGAVIKKYVIPNTVSQALYLGRAILLARRMKTDVIEAIFDITPGKLIFEGKIIDVRRDIERGYTMGSVLIEPETDRGSGANQHTNNKTDKRNMLIPFQNEYLYASLIDPSNPSNEEIVCVVPDLISLLSSADGSAVGSQDLRYGLKVKVIALPAHPLWTDDERGLKVGGPEYFGLKERGIEWARGRGGLAGYGNGPRSVIAEFGM